jgi:hypothetical protein
MMYFRLELPHATKPVEVLMLKCSHNHSISKAQSIVIPLKKHENVKFSPETKIRACANMVEGVNVILGDTSCHRSRLGDRQCHRSWLGDTKCHRSRLGDRQCHRSWLGDTKCHRSRLGDRQCHRSWLGDTKCHRSSLGDRQCHRSWLGDT